jgi:hypothetical protein
MVGLGQTSNPVDLIPGDAGAIAKVATQLYDYGILLTEAGIGLSRIGTSAGWTGPAAEAFRQRFTEQPAKWQEAGSCFTTAAKALEDYIPMLILAQKAAGVAIQMWAHGNKKGARTTLASAQSQLAAAAGNANAVIGAARDKAPPHPGFWSDIGHFFSSLGHDVVGGAEGAVNDLASLGNAVIHDPGADAGVLGGLALVAVSGGGEVLGTVVSATGVGAPVGAPLTVTSAAGITAGTGMTLAAAAKLGSDAAGDDQVEPLDTGGGSSGSGGNDTPRSYADKTGSIAQKTGYTPKQINRAIEAVKGGEAWRDYSGVRNPDVWVDTSTGEVYPKVPDGAPAEDSIGNIYDHLPDKPGK